MKTYIKLFIAIAFMVATASCSSSRVNIAGEPGTKIINLEGTVLGVIDNTGVAKIKLGKGHHFLYLSQAPGNPKNKWVPFGIDFKKGGKSRTTVTISSILTLGYASIFGIHDPYNMDNYELLPNQQTNNDLVR